MRTSDIARPLTAKSLNESLFKQFNVKINFDKYTREQLEDARNKYRSKLFAQEAQANFNDLLNNESYQRDKFVLNVLNTRIKEMLGESITKLETKLAEGKKKAKPDFLDMDKDGNKKETMKKAVADKKGGPKKGVNPFAKKTNEALKGGQKKLDVDKDGDIEADDLADLRAGKKSKKVKEATGKFDKTSTTWTDKSGKKHPATRVTRKTDQLAQGEEDPVRPAKSIKKKANESRNVIAESIAYYIAEDEEGKAKSITAAADMVNDFTSWMQRVGNYQTKSMIELADNIRANFGMQEAETFKQSVGSALEGALQSLTQAREEINNAVAVLAGEAPAEEPMGMDGDMGGDVGDIGSDMEIEPGAGDDMNAGGDEFAASDAAAGGPETTGRMKRESIERGNRLMKILGN
jgi:hypothetical protein